MKVSFAFAFVTVSVIRVKRLAIAAFFSNVFFIIASCLWFLIILSVFVFDKYLSFFDMQM